MKWQKIETRKQKETEREIQSRGGPALRELWRPWTRGETLLPSRGEANEEEEGGGLSPPLSQWRQSAAGARIVTAIYIDTSILHHDFLLLFIMFLCIIMLYGVILMPFLS